MKEKKKQGKISFKTTLLLYALIPLITTVLVVGSIAAVIMISNLRENTIEELHVAADGLKQYMEYDLVNSKELENGWLEYAPEEYIDKVKDNTDIDRTVFKDNIRFMTTLRNEDGSRNEGTEASEEVWAAVKNGDSYSSTSVKINGKKYYVFYLPLHHLRIFRQMTFRQLHLLRYVEEGRIHSIFFRLF